MSEIFNACLTKVANRGSPPVGFLTELVAWAKIAPDEIFAHSEKLDIYVKVQEQLGPFETPLNRKAAMLEVLRVLGGFESSWHWAAAIDITNPASNTPCTEEAGIFQCSGDSMGFDPSLKRLLEKAAGKTDCDTFRDTTKTNHAFAIEYCARLLRFTVTHHGPIKRDEINPWLNRVAMEEFAEAIAA